MRAYRIFLCLFCLLLAGTKSLLAQSSGRIDGRVIDGETGEVLAGANLLLEDSNQWTTSDTKGQFEFESLAANIITISAGYIGYRVAKLRVDLSRSQRVTVTIPLQPIILQGQAIVVTATRAIERETPVTFSNITAEQIDQQHTVADLPMLLSQMPNTYSYSLTGDELGYTFLKIRGFDQKRIGVMINDIPLNDPEDQQVYWVDLPDLAESAEDIQVQRGVGNAGYGHPTFGGSVNIKTEIFASEREIKIMMGGGSYNTRKLLAEYKSGLLQNTYAIYGRFSRILSDGYRRNSSSDLTAFFLGFEKYDRDMITRLNIFYGTERTHPDWDGIPRDMLSYDRRYKKEMYPNAVDDFKQPQYQLINDWQISPFFNLSNTFYYIRGQGYYENLKEQTRLREYGMDEFNTTDPALFGADSLDYYATAGDSTLFRESDGSYRVEKTDLVRQKWVEKNQYGWIGKLNYNTEDAIMTFGTSIYLFDSDHYGKVLWAKNIPADYSAEYEYHGYNGLKYNVSVYLNYLYRLMRKTTVMTNLLYEHKQYTFEQRAEGLFRGSELNRYQVGYDFFNPRVGLNYDVSPDLNVYGNISVAQREPSDDDLFDQFTGADDLGADPLFERTDTVRTAGRVEYVRWSEPLVYPELVLDYEAGLGYQQRNWNLKLNVYYMDFRNEIVPLGTVDNDGMPVKGNAEQTIHAGVEFSIAAKPLSYFSLDGNIAWSENYFKKYTERVVTDWNTMVVSRNDLSGNPIAGFPGLVANVCLGLKGRNLYSCLLYRYIGKQYLDNYGYEDRTIDPFNRLDLILDYRLDRVLSFAEIRLLLKINNVLDALYETAGYYDSWDERAYYYPAAPRNYYLSVGFLF
jgi:iron complex outermembrane recepter protein